jgi:hypothetical protein
LSSAASIINSGVTIFSPERVSGRPVAWRDYDAVGPLLRDETASAALLFDPLFRLMIGTERSVDPRNQTEAPYQLYQGITKGGKQQALCWR